MLPESGERRVLLEIGDPAIGRQISDALVAEGFAVSLCDGRGPRGLGCPLLLGRACPLLRDSSAVVCGLWPGPIAEAVQAAAPNRTELVEPNSVAAGVEAVRRIRSRRARSVKRLVEVRGRHLLVRAAAPADDDRIRAFDAALSERTRFLRYLSRKPPLTDAAVERMADVDFDHRCAFVVIEGRGPDRRIVGDARLIEDSDHPGRAELAIVLADDLQGLGVGPQLVQLLVEVAAERGFDAVGAEVWWENLPMAHVLRRLGFQRVAWELGVMTFVLPLRAG
jgi:acetyltransferase